MRRPDPLNHALLDLFLLVLLQRWNNHVLHMPCVLVRHNVFLAVLQHLQDDAGHVGLVAELGHLREERLEVEDDGAGEWEAAERLPVDAQVATVEGQFRTLEVAVLLMWVAGRHIKGLIDFEAPRAALDGLEAGHFGEESDPVSWAMEPERKTYRSMENCIFSL